MTTHPSQPAGLSQCDIILGALVEDGGWLSALELHNLSGSLAVHSRISDLRKRGHAIAHFNEWRDGQCRSFYRITQPLPAPQLESA